MIPEMDGLLVVREIITELLEEDHAARATARRARMVAAVDSIVRHCRRSLLDFLNVPRTTTSNPELVDALERLKRRVHNDLSMLHEQLMIAFEIYTSPTASSETEFLPCSRTPIRPPCS
jgi:hypothetical protein